MALAIYTTCTAPRVAWPLPVQPPVERGLVFLRVQRPGAAGVEHLNLPSQIRLSDAAMLDDPGSLPVPLLIERIQLKADDWLLLERQLALQSRSTPGGTFNIQTIQVLDVQALPNGVQIMSGTAGMAACHFDGKPDPDLVAVRRLRTDDHRRSQFQDLLKVWRVDRRNLRLQPVAAESVSCNNPAEGVP
jgi:hypothetical protein